MALCWLASVMPSILKVRQRDWPVNLWHLTSMGWHLTRQPLLQHSSTSSEYLALFLLLASSVRSSQGTVSFRRIAYLKAAELRTMSGLSMILATALGNFNCFLRSTLSSQLCVNANRSGEVFRIATAGFSLALMKAMVFFIGRGSCCG